VYHDIIEACGGIEPAAFWTATATGIYLSNGPGSMVRITATMLERRVIRLRAAPHLADWSDMRRVGGLVDRERAFENAMAIRL